MRMRPSMTLDLTEFNQAVLALYARGLSLGNFADRAARFARAVVDCELCSFGELSLRNRKLTVEFDRCHPDLAKALDGYGQHMFKHGLTRFDPAESRGRPFIRSDFLSHREFRGLDVFIDGFAVAGIGDHAAVPIQTNEDSVLYLGLERCGASRFGEDDRVLLEMLQPHLCNARAIAVACAEVLPERFDAVIFMRRGLTLRQADVLTWMAQGKSNAEISRILGLRLQTVKGYVTEIFNQLGVDNRYAAILRALEWLRREQASPDERMSSRATVRVKNAHGGEWKQSTNRFDRAAS